jgi:hypothetical protein
MAENVEYVVSAKDLASDVFASVEKGLKGIGEQATDLKAKVGSLVSTVGAGIFAHMIDETIRGEAELTTFGQIAGVSAVKFSTLTEAAALSRTPLNDVAGIVSKLSQVVGQAKLGDEGKKSLFAALGIDPNDGKDAADRLLQVAKAVTNMADQDVAAYATRQLLNKSFAEARPLLAQLAEQESLTTRATSEGIVAAKQYEDGTRRLSYEAGQAKIVFVNEWLPAINGVVEAMVKAQKEGGTLAAVIAGIQTTITGTDQYKNDKELTRLTELQKQIQDKIDELKVTGDMATPGAKGDEGPGTLKYWKTQLEQVNAQLATTLAYRDQLAKPASPGGVQKSDGMDNAAIDEIIKGALAEKAVRARMEFEKNYAAMVAAAQAKGQEFAAAMRLNTALAQEAYKQGEIDQVEYIRRQASNEDASLAAKIAALQKEEELAQKKGDKEREQIAKNGIAAAQAERTAQGLINRARIDAALEGERDEGRIALQKLLEQTRAIETENKTDVERLRDQLSDKQFILDQARANDMISEAAYQQQKLTLQQRYAIMEQQLEQRKAQSIAQAYIETGQLAVQFLQQIAGQSRAGALVVLAAQKGLAIAETIISTQAAVMRTFAELGPIGGVGPAATIESLGWAKVGIIAATGIAEAAGVGGGSSSPISVTPVSPSGLPSTPTLPTPIGSSTDEGSVPVTVNVVIQGNVLSKDFVVNDVIPVIKDAVNNRDAVIIGQNSRQAQVIGDGLSGRSG